MAESEIVHVAIAPPDMLEANLVKKVAAIVNKDLYETRLMLVGKIPKIIAHYKSMQMAELAAQSLRDLGLMVIVCTDSKLRKPSQCFSARTLKFGQQEVLFCDKGGQLTRMDSRNTFLILGGRMPTYAGTEVTTTKMKFSLPATVLTGGLPVWRRVKEKTVNQSGQTESFLRLYDHQSLDPIVEILQYHIDYSFLEATMSPSPILNFNAAVKKIRDIFPQTVFDNRLTEPFGINIPSTTPQDNIEINCKLIYLYHRAIRDLGSLA